MARSDLISLELNSKLKSAPPPGPPGELILNTFTPGISGSSARHISCISKSVSVLVSPFVNSANISPPRLPLSKVTACFITFSPVSFATFSSIRCIAPRSVSSTLSRCSSDEPGSNSKLAIMKSLGILGKNTKRTIPPPNIPIVRMSMAKNTATVV